MNQQLGQPPFRPANEGAEQRILEPAQRRVGGNPSHVDVHAAGLEIRREPLRAALLEVAPIGGTPHDEMTPETGLEAELGGSENVPDHIGPVELHVGGVAAFRFKTELLAGERKHILAGAKPGEKARFQDIGLFDGFQACNDLAHGFSGR